MNSAREALDRTALLLRLDVFRSQAEDDPAIVDGLRATSARIIADKRNLTTIGGQTTVVTLHNQLVMLGIQVEIVVPTLLLSAPQPPLPDGDLSTSLRAYSDDLIPGGSSLFSGEPDIVFAIGDTPAPADAVRLDGEGMRARVGRLSAASASRWSGDPFVAMAAAATAAAEGARAAIPRIADRLDVNHGGLPKQWLPGTRRISAIDLSMYDLVQSLDLGEVDLISGGAINQAALYALLRVDDLQARIRVIEPEDLDLSNLNRYALSCRRDLGRPKIDVLTDLSTGSVQISGVSTRFTSQTLPTLGALAPRILVGVDHIPSRWSVQEVANDAVVIVGSTSHDYALVSTHPHGGPCAGCVHPRDDSAIATIPTISFVSFWAGLLGALELLRSHGQEGVTSDGIHIWPLGMDNPRGLHRFVQSRNPDCPISRVHGVS